MGTHNDAAAAGTAADTMSPLRKAMSLSTLFRHTYEGRAPATSDSKAWQSQHASSSMATCDSTQKRRQQQQQQHDMRTASSSQSTSNTPVATPTTSTLRRMRRRLSLRSTPTSAGATLPSVIASSSASSNGSWVGTPSSAGSSSTASPSTTASTPPSVRSRPRSGSTRSLFLNGARVLPFTLPAMTDEESSGSAAGAAGDDTTITPRRKRSSTVTFVTRPPSISPPIPPRRPLTPAPLLILDEELNSLGISTGPFTGYHTIIASPIASSAHRGSDGSAAVPRSHTVHDRPMGLGLSAMPMPPTQSTNFGMRNSVRDAAMNELRRVSLLPSQESFQCRGCDDEDEFQQCTAYTAAALTSLAPPMTRSVSASTVTSSTRPSHARKIDVGTGAMAHGSPLGWRRRPWALSLQLQSPSIAADVGATVTDSPGSTPTSHRVPYVEAIEESVTKERVTPNSLSPDPRSRFSSVSSIVSSADDRETGIGATGNVASPSSDRSSSEYSFDTTLESPVSRQDRKMPSSGPATAATVTGAPSRRRSSTISIVQDSVAMNRKAIGIVRPPSMMGLPSICPASPPAHVRLTLALPPTAVAKHAVGTPEQSILIATTATTLEFKEEICRVLQLRFALSISPSQLALFVHELLPSPALSLGDNSTGNGKLAPSRSLSRRRPVSSGSSGGGGGGSLRSRLRTSINVSRSPPHSASSLSSATFAKGGPPSLRQLDNEAALYQQGLQDDDRIIVRF